MYKLAQDSTVIVRGTALSNPTIERIADIPFTVTTVKVIEKFRGAPVETFLKVRQTGDTSLNLSDEFPAILQSENEYLLFLEPFVLKSGNTDQYVITGDAGGFHFESNGKAHRLDAMSTKLPLELTTESITQLINGVK